MPLPDAELCYMVRAIIDVIDYPIREILQAQVTTGWNSQFSPQLISPLDLNFHRHYANDLNFEYQLKLLETFRKELHASESYSLYTIFSRV